MRKTRIICTLGPAVDSVEQIKALLAEGMDGARFNFSHGSHESQLATLRRLRQAVAESGRDVAVILDTKGPEIRIRTFAEGAVELAAGAAFCLCTDDVPGTAEQVSVTYAELDKELAPGQSVLIDDGLIDLRVERIEPGRIHCRVAVGGTLSNNKSINLPGASIHLPSLTEKDKEDLRFAVENDFDYIAASFIRSAADVAAIREELARLGGPDLRIISKVENEEGVEHLEEIVTASDGIMVARGDLGVEIPAVKVPGIQHRMIRSCRLQGKTVIIATQMLDSMIKNPRPTRAEVSDVANAVFDYASCVMLSGETASGKYPVEALRTMREIVEEAESTIDYWRDFQERNDRFSYDTVNQAISHSCCHTAFDLKAQAIITATQSGYSAKMISRFRPACEIVAVTPIPRVFRQLWLVWGVHPLLSEPVESTDAMLALCRTLAQREGLVRKGDAVVIAAGSPIGTPGSTNLIQAGIIE